MPRGNCRHPDSEKVRHKDGTRDGRQLYRVVCRLCRRPEDRDAKRKKRREARAGVTRVNLRPRPGSPNVAEARRTSGTGTLAEVFASVTEAPLNAEAAVGRGARSARRAGDVRVGRGAIDHGAPD